MKYIKLLLISCLFGSSAFASQEALEESFVLADEMAQTLYAQLLQNIEIQTEENRKLRAQLEETEYKYTRLNYRVTGTNQATV